MSALENFSRWVYVMQQIHEAKHYIGRAVDMGHPHLWTSYEPILDFLAFFKGALNSYAKCFVSAGSGRRRLESAHIFKHHEDLARRHNEIMNLRHTYVAHPDENSLESAEMIHEDSGAELVLRLRYGFSFPFDRLYELRDLIHFIELYVVETQEEHLEAISKNVGKPVLILGIGNNASMRASGE